MVMIEFVRSKWRKHRHDTSDRDGHQNNIFYTYMMQIWRIVSYENLSFSFYYVSLPYKIFFGHGYKHMKLASSTPLHKSNGGECHGSFLFRNLHSCKHFRNWYRSYRHQQIDGSVTDIPSPKPHALVLACLQK
jgi:hypothetical protein